jgi:hypothetical protein
MRTFLLIATAVSAVQAPRPFTPAKIDSTATYAIHLTQASDGTWNERETVKLCPIPEKKGRRGEPIRFAAVAVSKDCPR